MGFYPTSWIFFVTLVAITLSDSLPVFAAAKKPKRPDDVIEVTDYTCSSAREFITVMNYLRENAAFGLKDQSAQEVALAVTAGCSGAAKRFIQVTDILVKAGLPSKEALENAMAVAKGEEDQAEAFLVVFKRAFLRDGLDMKIEDALLLARSLSVELRGDRVKAREDFEKLVDYCVDVKELALPKPKCGTIAAKIAAKGQNSTEGVAKPFIQTIEFLTESSDGPQLPLYQAFAIAEELAIVSPDALENYVSSYKWLTSKSGLSLDRKDAVGTAKKIAAKTAQKRLVRYENK